MVGLDQLYTGAYWIAGACLFVNRNGLVLAVGLFRLVAVTQGAVDRSGNLLLMRNRNNVALPVGKNEVDGKDADRWR